jgi:hypothetical protein
MRALESNLAFVQACLDELQDYERAEALFWTLSACPPEGSPPFLQMTMGNLMLALDEMRAVESGLSPRDRTVLTQVCTEWESRWTSRSVRLENKAAREVGSRIVQWRASVTDMIESGDLSEYATHIRPRLCAARLLESLGVRHMTRDRSLAELEAIDTGLGNWMEEGPCVLGPEMALVYPPTPSYRFLYRQPRRRRSNG